MITYNPNFVAKSVRKAKNGECFSDPATIIYFPEETEIKDEVIKNIDPIWCMEAKTICAPDSTVKIPKKVCKKRNIKTNKVEFLK